LEEDVSRLEEELAVLKSAADKEAADKEATEKAAREKAESDELARRKRREPKTYSDAGSHHNQKVESFQDSSEPNFDGVVAFSFDHDELLNPKNVLNTPSTMHTIKNCQEPTILKEIPKTIMGSVLDGIVSLDDHMIKPVEPVTTAPWPPVGVLVESTAINYMPRRNFVYSKAVKSVSKDLYVAINNAPSGGKLFYSDKKGLVGLRAAQSHLMRRHELGWATSATD